MKEDILVNVDSPDKLVLQERKEKLVLKEQTDHRVRKVLGAVKDIQDQ